MLWQVSQSIVAGVALQLPHFWWLQPMSRDGELRDELWRRLDHLRESEKLDDGSRTGLLF